MSDSPYYACPLNKLDTFTYQPLNSSQSILHIADWNGERYFRIDDLTTPLPQSPVSQFTQVDLTSDSEAALKANAVCDPKLIRSLATAQQLAIGVLQGILWAKMAAGYQFTSSATSSLSFPVAIRSVVDEAQYDAIFGTGVCMKQNLHNPADSFQIFVFDANGVQHNLTPDDAVSLGMQTMRFALSNYNWYASQVFAVVTATTYAGVNQVLTNNGGNPV